MIDPIPVLDLKQPQDKLDIYEKQKRLSTIKSFFREQLMSRFENDIKQKIQFIVGSKKQIDLKSELEQMISQ